MINEQNKQSWCVNADFAMSANNDGTTKICCMIRNKEKLSLSTATIEDNFNQPEFIEIRDALGKGERHAACSWCWQEEDSGRKSKRLRDNEKYINHVEKGGAPFNGLAKLELNLGNTCNLKCRTCAPHSSSQWMKEEFDLNESKRYGNDFKRYSIEMKKYHQTYDDESEFWEDILTNLPTIRQLDFYGGEPFMSNKMWRTLQIAVDLGYSKDIELHYATNGTQWPEDKVEIFKSFRHLNLNFSIDGIGKHFEFMRFPADWTEVTINMEKAREFKKTHHDMQLSWCSTLSLLNIYELPILLDEFYKTYGNDFGIYLNLVHGPYYFNISNISPEYKEKLIERLNSIPKEYNQIWESYLPGIINFMNNGTFNPTTWEKFKQVVKTHDDYRNQNFAEVFPEAAKIIGL